MADYLSTSQVAESLRIDLEAVRALCRSNAFPGAIKNPRDGHWIIPASDLEQYQSSRTETQPAFPASVGGDQISVSQVTGSTLAVGREAHVEIQQGVSGAELGELFERIYARIQERPTAPDVEKEEIVDTVQRIEGEVAKGEEANTSKLERWLKTLAQMAPDIFDVVAATLTSPAAGIATVIRKVIAKARQEAGA